MSNKKPIKPFSNFLNTEYKRMGSEILEGDTINESLDMSDLIQETRVVKEIYEHYELNKQEPYSPDEFRKRIDILLARLILDFEYGIDWKDEDAIRDKLWVLMEKHVPASKSRIVNRRKAIHVALVDYFTEKKGGRNNAYRYLKNTHKITRVKQNYNDYKKRDKDRELIVKTAEKITATANKKNDSEKEEYYLLQAEIYHLV